VKADLNTRTQYTDYSISLQGGFREDYFTASNLGSANIMGVWIDPTSSCPEIFVGLAGSIVQDKYVPNEKDYCGKPEVTPPISLSVGFHSPWKRCIGQRIRTWKDRISKKIAPS